MPQLITSDTYLRPTDRDPSSALESLRSRFKLYLLIWLGLAISAPVAAIYLQRKGSEQPLRPVRLASGAWVASEAAEQRLSLDDFQVNAREILEAFFCWTEKGGVEAVRPFVKPHVWDDMVKRMKPHVRGKMVPSHLQELIITELRMTVGKSGRYIAYRFAGVLRARSANDYTANPVYYAVLFHPSEPTVENPLGWQLATLKNLDAKEYYEESRDAAVSAATSAES